MIRTCIMCPNTFDTADRGAAGRNAKTCSDECSKARTAAMKQRWKETHREQCRTNAKWHYRVRKVLAMP